MDPMGKFTEAQVQENLQKLSNWSYENGAIQRNYTFKDFREAFSFMTRLAFECEALNHHPNWSNVYNSVTIRLNTHDVNGVTQKDFELAQIIENIAGQ